MGARRREPEAGEMRPTWGKTEVQARIPKQAPKRKRENAETACARIARIPFRHFFFGISVLFRVSCFGFRASRGKSPREFQESNHRSRAACCRLLRCAEEVWSRRRSLAGLVRRGQSPPAQVMPSGSSPRRHTYRPVPEGTAGGRVPVRLPPRRTNLDRRLPRLPRRAAPRAHRPRRGHTGPTRPRGPARSTVQSRRPSNTYSAGP